MVDGVSLRVEPGEVVGLLGPNGAGKTTTFHMVVGLIRPAAGRVRLGERDLTRLPMHRRARRRRGLPAPGVVHLPQARRCARTSPRCWRRWASGGAAREARADALLAEFRLQGVADSLGETLSGGERRRAEVARSLLASPRFILFDEPFAGIDPIAVAELQRLIASLRARGLGVLLTDHNVREALGICDRAYILSAGKILEEGVPSAIAASERARAAYLGESFRLDAAAAARPDAGPGLNEE